MEDVDVQFDQINCLLENSGKLLKGVYSYGFEKPSYIQAKTIEPIHNGIDIIAQSQSGTGKTGAFVIGALSRIDVKLEKPQAIVIANTRELAIQIQHVIKNIGTFMNIKVALTIGGSPVNLTEIKNCHFIVGTPGRIDDILTRDEKSKTSRIIDTTKIIILDEADVLLNSDFVEQIHAIISKFPRSVQICIFSATYTDYIIKLTRNILNDPLKILIKQEELSLDNIRHYYVNVEEQKNKYDTMVDLYKGVSICQVVIFVNSIKRAKTLKKMLSSDTSVDTIHAELSEIERMEILRKFRRSELRVIVATDILARGIDIQQIGLVINYDLPKLPEVYIHRVGRSGRFGKLGVAINFMTQGYGDYEIMKNIERIYEMRINQLPDLDEINHYLTGAKGFHY
jgi:translation initiation factor 4A